MWNGKKRAVTFSFDDGVRQDVRVVEILNKYGLKGTFNLNSGTLGMGGETNWLPKVVSYARVQAEEVRDVYAGHEVAVHTVNHPHLTKLTDDEIVREVEDDRAALSKLCGYDVIGLAYPYGDYDDRVVELLRTRTGVRYGRGVIGAKDFSLPKEQDLFSFDPTIYFVDEKFEEKVDEFLALDTDEPQMLYIWGHAYELDAELITWEKFEAVCKKLAGRSEIFYGTNKEVLL